MHEFRISCNVLIFLNIFFLLLASVPAELPVTVRFFLLHFCQFSPTWAVFRNSTSFRRWHIPNAFYFSTKVQGKAEVIVFLIPQISHNLFLLRIQVLLKSRHMTWEWDWGRCQYETRFYKCNPYNNEIASSKTDSELFCCIKVNFI